MILKNLFSMCLPRYWSYEMCLHSSLLNYERNMDISTWKKKFVDELNILELAYAHLGSAGSYRLKDGWLKSILPITLQEINHAGIWSTLKTSSLL
jgi:hypothetical protein